MTDLSILIVNWNTRDLLAQCLRSVYRTTSGLDLEIIVVDNASTDGSVAMVKEQFPQVRIIANAENVGFVRANNQALTHCQGRYVLLLNSDTQVLPGSLSRAVQFMNEHPKAGMMGVRLLNPDGTFQASYTPFPTLWREFLILSGLGRWLVRPTFPSYGPRAEGGAQRIEGYLEGAYLMARREAVDEIGGLDEHIFMYAEDVDWCFRFYRAGWEVWYLPDAPIIHYGGQSSKKRRGRMEAELYRSRVYFFRKHYGKFAAICLKVLIYAMTLPKIFIHGLLRSVTRGRKGRIVTSWEELRLALDGLDSTSEEKIPA
ncbi:MAG: glycosyltransferase family 2 protein [Anaerolineae bacterium]|jgi:GT2 family glycosyltransferase|nr:glycosyltransferase family 2 protein [Anaerolineae bacterium]MDH7473306.1 glycosyltransferase family 2 protein [Anaerolineae bacterium]